MFLHKLSKKNTKTTFRSEESAKQICQGLSTNYTASANGENIFEKIVEIFDRSSPPPKTPKTDKSLPTGDSEVNDSKTKPSSASTLEDTTAA